MSTTKQLGGDRVGSGNKMNVELHGFNRSTHDIGETFRTTMAAGTLVPCYTTLTMPGDTMDINLNTLIRTPPTQAALMGSFKFQIDAYSIPIRLYNASLHMNRIGIGLKMNQIKFPMMHIACKGEDDPEIAGKPNRFNQSSLMAYLGVRGAPKILQGGVPTTGEGAFNKQALLLCSYWDIYKNYYADKQQEIGYFIGQKVPYTLTTIQTFSNGLPLETATIDPNNGQLNPLITIVPTFNALQINYTGTVNYQELKLEFQKDSIIYIENITNWFNITDLGGRLELTPIHDPAIWEGVILYSITPPKETASEGIALNAFPLENIDKTQLEILQKSTDTPYMFNENSLSPYVNCIGTVFPSTYLPNYFSQNGLGIKTYQSDIFNNWLNTDWIDGENGINQITAISTEGNQFTLDSFLLAKKVYDLLNRIAVSGGSYDDWQQAVWDEETFRKAESPIYLGGMQSEIVFEEIISTADAKSETYGEQPLGSLAGRGTQTGKKGGNITVKTTEPSVIMLICSITPRIDYSQGNAWFTRLETMDDLHKPSLDGIGFQELITESQAHWDATYESTTGKWTYKSAGKQPAWIDYMTSYNKTYGHFAENEGDEALMQMTLNRQYEFEQVGVNNNGIKDLTTYIDPTKYNYAFATVDLSAQNFWVQISIDNIARRKMSAKIIPNL